MNSLIRVSRTRSSFAAHKAVYKAVRKAVRTVSTASAVGFSLALLGLTLTACGDTGKSGSGDTGGTLVVSTSADADNFIPPLVMTSQGRQVSEQVFEFLA